MDNQELTKEVLVTQVNDDEVVIVEDAKTKEARIMELVKSTQASTALTLKSLDQTLANVDQTLKGIAETTQKMDDFSKIFSSTMNEMAIKFLTVPDNLQPEVSDVESLAKDLVRCSNVIFVLGQETTQFLDIDHEVDEPQKRQLQNLNPSELHKSLAKTLIRLNIEDQFMIIVSEVADGLMRKSFSSFQSFNQEEEFRLLNNQSLIIEMNGNINFLNCFNTECEQKEFPSPTSDQVLQMEPICPACSIIGTPSYLKPQCDTQMEILFSSVDDRTCLVLLGSIFINPFVQQLIKMAIEDNSLIIEISEMPKLEVGRVKQLIGNPNEITSIFCESIMEQSD